MMRTTLVSAGEAASVAPQAACERGSLKVFLSYAPCSGATAAMLDEANGLTASGRDVLVADPACALGGHPSAFDLDQALKRRPDVVVLEDLALPNPPEARNRTRYQDAEELLRAGVDVYATLRVSDLQNEQDRVRALGLEAPAEPVPDYILYGARQLEFVDIDPAELLSRAKAAGREVPEQALNELRLLALRCVSEYASASAAAAPQAPGAPEAEQNPLYNLVVAVVEPGLAPGDVLLEASRLASAARADLEVVCVRSERKSTAAAAAQAEEAYATLVDQVEAMGCELVTYHGDDPAELVRDYLRTQGASDVVLARRPRSLAARVLQPFQAPFEDRAVEGLANVSVHLVANPATAPEKPGAHGLARLAGVRLRDLLIAALAVVASYLAASGLGALGFGDAVSYVVFLGAFVGVAALTRSYIASSAAVLAGCLVQDYYFVGSYRALSIDDRAAFLAFAVFVAVAVACTFAMVGIARSAARASQRERRTQALFDLNRSLLYAHGTAEVVELALNSVARLFERSTAIYLVDPFADARPGERERRAAVIRPVLGDVGEDVFHKITEQAVAHWVFVNGELAGNGTDTHGESDLLYLPLTSEEGLEGVLVVSTVAKPLGLADRSFLDLVANQAALALERQSLAAKHRSDLSAMRVTRVRNAFVGRVVASAALVANTVHAISDMAAAAPEDDAAYRDVLVRTASEESARGRLVVDRMRAAVEAPISSQCDVRAEVAAAVDEVREGLAGKVIDLEPGDPVPPVAADAALVRAAVRLILEASTSYVGARGIVQVSVTAYPDRINVAVADDRPAQMSAPRAAAFDLSTKAGHEGEPVYDEMRAQVLLDALRDRAAVTADPHAPLLALCRAMRLPQGVVRSEGDRGDGVNRQRVQRYDRLEYGLFVAALIVHAHGGTVKQRYRLGGGAVVTLTLPRT